MFDNYLYRTLLYNSWDKYFLNLAKYVSTKSKDNSTKCGAIIVGEDHEILSTGYNGFCRNIDDNVESRYKRPEKYYWFEHAERNAIYNAARIGVSIKGAHIYVTGPPCHDCGRAIIQSGIISLVYPFEDYSLWRRNDTSTPDQWFESFYRSQEMMLEVGVDIRVLCMDNIDDGFWRFE